MTALGTFIQESPYPGKELSMQENQLIVEDSGPVTLGRIQELDKVGQIQWVSEDMRRLAYSLGQPVQPTPQPAPQPAPAPQQEPPSSSSSSSVLMAVIAIVAVLAICGGAYMLFSGMQADDTQPEAPATESAPEPEAPQPEPEAPAPEAPSDETT